MQTLISSKKQMLWYCFCDKNIIFVKYKENIIMDFQTTKIELIKHLLDVKKQSVLDRLSEILLNDNSSIDRDLSPMSIDELNSRIDKSEKDFKNGKVISSESLLSKYS